MDIYGFAMLDMGFQSGQNDPNWFDVLRPTKLPSFENEFGEDGRFFAGVRQSRLGVKGFIPTSAGEIKTIFEQWQLAEYLETAGWTEPFDPSIYEEEGEDPEFIEMERKDNLRRVANEMLLIERAKEWRLEHDDK